MKTTSSLVPTLTRAWLLLASFVVAGTAFGQSTTGAITGTVIDTTTGKYVEGAEVTLQNSSLRTTTAREGTFTLEGVPVGAQTVVATYPGLETKTEAVTVTAGQTATVPVRLSSAEVLKLGEYKVSGTKEGMAQAVAIQKISVQYKLVAAADQFGAISEGNIGEYLKFLPGVSVDFNVNDARGVSLRGLSTAFTIVAVDGTPMAGTSSIDDTRRFEFEQIAMNNVETTELFKTVTPDISASATGGFVNFVTKSAFDREKNQLITYDVSFSAPSTNLHFDKQGGVWGHEKEYTIRPNLELNVARKINEKVGINFNYRFSEKYDDSPRHEFTWNQLAPSGSNPGINVAPLLQQFNIRQEEKLTHRESFATKVDYRISKSTKLFVAGQWNWYDLNFTQRGPFLILGNASTRNADGSYTSGAGASFSNQTLYRNKYGTTWHFNGTLTHEFENESKLQITPYWSRANGQYRDTSKGFISTTATLTPAAGTFTGFTIGNVFERATNPTLAITNAGTPVSVDLIRTLGNYSLTNTTGTNLQSRPWTAIDEKEGVNGSYNFGIKSIPVPIKFEAGFAVDNTERSIDRPDYRYTLSPAITGAALTALQDPNYNKDVAFGFGPIQAIDPYKSWDLVRNNAVILSVYDKRHIKEKNDAVYLRADATLFSDFLFTGGLRWEKRKIDATAKTGAPARAVETTSKLDYNHYYPSLSMKYTPHAIRPLVVRAGYSRTIGHPDYGDILPNITSPTAPGASDGSITVPASTLNPYFTTNYDLSFDYYLKNSGVVGLAVFRKDVSNFIVSRSMTAAERDFYIALYGLNPADFGALTTGTIKENGAKTSLQGAELSYAQNLTFIPQNFGSVNVQANFTYIDIDASDPDPFRQLDAEYAQSRAVSPRTANLILGYRKAKFSFTSTTNWVDASLFGGFVATNAIIGNVVNTANPTADTRLALYRDQKITTDFNFQYAFHKNVTVYFLIRNVFNSRRDDYAQGYLPQNQNIRLPYRTYEFGEPHFTLGFKGTF
jgi:iron complex outermembrane receptor protein